MAVPCRIFNSLPGILTENTEWKSRNPTKPLLACGPRFGSVGNVAVRVLIFPLILLMLLSDGRVSVAELTEEEKRELFLRSREKMRTLPLPAPETPQPTATPAPRATPPPRVTPRQRTRPERTRPTPTPTPTPTPAPRATPTPAPTPTPDEQTVEDRERGRGLFGRIFGSRRVEEDDAARESAAVSVRRSGTEPARGYEPPRRIRGRWAYLTPEVRQAIDSVQIKRNRWKYIVIHNSATRQGNARIFENYHRNVRRMRNGLAYHFVIGNGTSSGDGQIEVGSRWRGQIDGGHVASDHLNSISIGICLVGDFNRDQPTRAQVQAMDELVDYLRRRVGRVDGGVSEVRGHKDMNPRSRPTSCPGDSLYHYIRRKYR